MFVFSKYRDEELLGPERFVDIGVPFSVALCDRMESGFPQNFKDSSRVFALC